MGSRSYWEGGGIALPPPPTGLRRARSDCGPFSPRCIQTRFSYFLLRVRCGRWLRSSPAADAEQPAAARDDAAPLGSRHSLLIFFHTRPLRDPPLDIILVQLQLISPVAAECSLQRRIATVALVCLPMIQPGRRALSGQAARLADRIHRQHRRYRLALASRPTLPSSPCASTSPGQHAAIRSLEAAGEPARRRGQAPQRQRQYACACVCAMHGSGEGQKGHHGLKGRQPCLSANVR